MSALIYTYSTTSYYSTVLPKGPLESYNKENLRTVSRLLQPPSSALLSPFGTEVSLYIHHTHCFVYRSLPDHLVAFIVLIDINPQNDLVEPDYSLRTTISGQSKYFLRWDSLPCIIPHYLYKGLKSRAELYDLNTTHCDDLPIPTLFPLFLLLPPVLNMTLNCINYALCFMTTTDTWNEALVKIPWYRYNS